MNNPVPSTSSNISDDLKKYQTYLDNETNFAIAKLEIFNVLIST